MFGCVCVHLCDCFCPLSPSHWLSFLYATSLCRVQITKLFTEKTCNCVSEHTSTQAQKGKVNTCTIAKLRPTAVPRTNHQAFTEQSEIRHHQVAKPLEKSFTPAQFMSSASRKQCARRNAKKKSRMEDIFAGQFLQVVLRMSCVASSFSLRSGLGFTHAVCTVDTKRTGRTKVTLLVRSPSLHL